MEVPFLWKNSMSWQLPGQWDSRPGRCKAGRLHSRTRPSVLFHSIGSGGQVWDFCAVRARESSIFLGHNRLSDSYYVS